MCALDSFHVDCRLHHPDKALEVFHHVLEYIHVKYKNMMCMQEVNVRFRNDFKFPFKHYLIT